MASRAYQPELTLTPFNSFGVPPITESLTDQMIAVFRRNLHRQPAALADHQEDVHLPSVADRQAFHANLNQWLTESFFDSSPERMRDYDSYRAIVAQGKRVVPLIAAELRKGPTFLFLALEDIWGQNPVAPPDRGDVQATVDTWLRWLQR